MECSIPTAAGQSVCLPTRPCVVVVKEAALLNSTAQQVCALRFRAAGSQIPEFPCEPALNESYYCTSPLHACLFLSRARSLHSDLRFPPALCNADVELEQLITARFLEPSQNTNNGQAAQSLGGLGLRIPASCPICLGEEKTWGVQ